MREKKAPAGALQTRIGILKEKKAPAGTLKTRIGILKEKKAPAGALKTRMGILKKILKNVDFWKLLGMGWPGVGNVPRACGSILHLSRGSQEPILLAGWLACWLAGLLAGLLACLLACWLAGWLAELID